MATITINQLIEIEKTIDILGSESIKRIKAEVAKREREMPDEGCNTCVSLNPRLLDGTDANMDNICTHTETTLGDILIGTSGMPCRYYESIFSQSSISETAEN
jgi:hypothetical protein